MIAKDNGKLSFLKERWLEILGVLLGLSSLFVTIVLAFYIDGSPEINQLLSAFQWTVIALGGVIVLCFILLFILSRDNNRLSKDNTLIYQKKADYERLVKNQPELARIMHSVNHEARNMLCLLEQYYFENLEDDERKTWEQEIRESYKEFCQCVVLNIKALFDHLTGHTNAVTIKYFTMGKSGEIRDTKVHTYMRDLVSRNERGKADANYPEYFAVDNTAFEEILSATTDSHYMNNNLIKDPTYKNLHKGWEKYYNACLVSGMIIDHRKRKEYNIPKVKVGAVCVDSLEGGYTETGHNLLACITDILTAVFLQFNHVTNDHDV